jgi:hypothetical protein
MIDRFGRSVIADVPYEHLAAGPSGRLVEVIDFDGARQCFYEPVDLNDPDILRNHGIDLTETDPRFHQQMVYAIVMRVLESFERGLGRPFRWRGDQRLRVYPHALESANAYFDEELFALLFGTFNADLENPGPNLPGQRVFTCLSHDIVAHECTHAVIKRLRPHYSTPTNPDVLAFHEGFADVMAILQHFTYPEIVAEQVAVTRAKLDSPNSLLLLASQFGFALGDNAALRTGLTKPTTADYLASEEEHDRGSVLSSAIFGGFLRSWRESIADLVRLATAGSGILRPGALHPDLVDRVAAAAGATATRVSNMCVRAFDYLPPVDLTFGDYLRALVTADHELYPSDDQHLRANLIEEFRLRGIYAGGTASLSDRSLLLESADPSDFSRALPFVAERLLDNARELDRQRAARRNVERDDLGGLGERGDDDYVDRGSTGSRDSASQGRWASELHHWADEHRAALQLDPAATLAITGFHAGTRLDADGYARTEFSMQVVQRREDAAGELGGIVPLGGTTVVADSDGRVRNVVARPLPTEVNGGMDRIRGFVDAVEHRLTNAAWHSRPETRVIAQLNLRGVHDRRRNRREAMRLAAADGDAGSGSDWGSS